MLIKLHENNPTDPLFDLSERSSEQIFALQDKLEEEISQLISDEQLVQHVLTEYIPPVLVEKMGLETIENLLGAQELQPYRDTILTKKIASMAYYKFGAEWDAFLKRLGKDLQKALHTIIHKTG